MLMTARAHALRILGQEATREDWVNDEISKFAIQTLDAGDV